MVIARAPDGRVYRFEQAKSFQTLKNGPHLLYSGLAGASPVVAIVPASFVLFSGVVEVSRPSSGSDGSPTDASDKPCPQ